MNQLVNKIKALINSEAFRYIIVGGCTTLVNLVVFTVMAKGLSIDVTISNVTSVITAILFAYVTNKLFVFQSHCQCIKDVFIEASKFIGARLSTMVVEVGGVYLLVNIIGQDALVGKLETQIIVLVGNYFISKWLVFKDRAGKGDAL